MTRRLAVVAALAAVAFVGWFAVTSVAAELADGPADGAADGADDAAPAAALTTTRPIPVKTLPAKRQSTYLRTRHYTGTLVAARQSRLSFERSGRVLRMLVDEGARVHADQPLAELDRRHLSAERRAVVARLDEATALLEELVAGPRKERIASARALVRSLAAQRDSAEQNLQRRQALVETRAVSREEYDEMLYEYRSAAAQVDASQKELDELLAGTRKEQVAAQRARVEQLRAELADVDHDLEDSTLRAPYAGVIAERVLDEGAIVSPGQVVFRVLDAAAPELWVGLPGGVAQRLSLGATMPARVASESAVATVRSLRPEIDPTTRTRTVVLTVATSAAPGQIARVAVQEEVAGDGFWAPTAALTPRERGLWAVYVAEGEGPLRTVAIRDVEVIHSEASRSFVRGSLAEGDAILAAGAHRVVEGQQVTITATN